MESRQNSGTAQGWSVNPSRKENGPPLGAPFSLFFTIMRDNDWGLQHEYSSYIPIT